MMQYGHKDVRSALWLLCCLHMMPNDLIIIRLSNPHDIFRARLIPVLQVQSSCFSVLNFLLSYRTVSEFQSNIGKGILWEACSLSSPSQERSKADKSCALMGSGRIPGKWKCRHLCTPHLGRWDCSYPPSGCQHRSQLLPPSILRSWVRSNAAGR